MTKINKSELRSLAGELKFYERMDLNDMSVLNEIAGILHDMVQAGLSIIKPILMSLEHGMGITRAKLREIIKLARRAGR